MPSLRGRLPQHGDGIDHLSDVGWMGLQSASQGSVMLVEADTHDVVPTCGVVASEALFDARVLLAGNAFGNHRKVAHVVAGRCLVALRTLLGTR